MDYQAMRTFADSWGLVAMAVFFLVAVLFAFRPGSRKSAEELARLQLRDD
jgi:cytochrome c oxidase cbb3-type subunit 4